MLNINEVLSVKHFLCDYLFRKALIFIIPAGVGIYLLMGEKAWGIFWMTVPVVLLTEIAKYSKCKKKHEDLLRIYGDRYISLLEREIERVGVNTLVWRYWNGLEPK